MGIHDSRYLGAALLWQVTAIRCPRGAGLSVTQP